MDTMAENYKLGIGSRRRVDASPDLVLQLPQYILHQILYHVPIDDAARMAVLSKTCFQVWNTLPFLDFRRRLQFPTEKNTILLPYVDQILSNRKNQRLSIHKFTFGGISLKNLSSYLERWIEILRDLHIQHLCVCGYVDGNEYFTLPKTILSAQSINYLKLCGFNLDSLCRNEVKWPLLRKLSLKSVHVSDNLIHEIVTNCCGIEVITFKWCTGIKNIMISDLVKLQKFRIRAHYSTKTKVHINVPSLEHFSYEFPETQNCFNINACTRLKTLFLCGRGIAQNWVDKVFLLFPLLESLRLEYCNLVKLNISSCKLKHLRLSYCEYLVEANINTPNLSTFVYHGNGALFFSLNASPLLQVNVNLGRKFTINLMECAKVTNFLRAIGYFDRLRLRFYWLQNLAIPKEIRDGLDYSGCKLKNLLLYIDCKPDSDFMLAALDILDYLFCVYSRLESLCIIADNNYVMAPLKLLYEKLRDKEKILHCCDTHPIKCWRHFLEEVIFETPENDDEAQKHQIILYCRDVTMVKMLKIKLRPRS